jgi:hypothetical protein
MKTTGFPKPINDVQKEFRALCEAGGGVKGGPPRPKVQELLRSAGKKLNDFAFNEVSAHLSALSCHNPWHVCFAIGLSWGHLAKLDLTFSEAAANLLANWNASDLKTARSYHLERGPQPIEESLSGGYQLFQMVKLPDGLPGNLESIGRAQERWLTPILSPSRPKYIGSWNATAMFMVALFAQPPLAATMIEPKVVLPPGGPIFSALKLLHQAHVLASAPAGTDLDDEAFEPGALYENNGLMESLLKGLSGWSMVDLHSGLYLLGTRDPASSHWSA